MSADMCSSWRLPKMTKQFSSMIAPVKPAYYLLFPYSDSLKTLALIAS